MPPLTTGRNGEPTSTEPRSGVFAESLRKRRNFRLPVMSRVSIQSKLLVMLLITSVLSAAVVGAIGYQSGRNSLRASVFDGLTEIRQSQTRQLQAQGVVHQPESPPRGAHHHDLHRVLVERPAR
jgi:hypothetical protein